MSHFSIIHFYADAVAKDNATGKTINFSEGDVHSVKRGSLDLEVTSYSSNKDGWVINVGTTTSYAINIFVEDRLVAKVGPNSTVALHSHGLEGERFSIRVADDPPQATGYSPTSAIPGDNEIKRLAKEEASRIAAEKEKKQGKSKSK